MLIPEARLTEAAAAARALGFRPLPSTAAGARGTVRVKRLGSPGITLQLRSSPVDLAWEPEPLLRRVQPAGVEDVRVSVPAATDRLVHACVRAVTTPPSDPIWILDAAAAADAGGLGEAAPFDWEGAAGYARLEAVRFPVAAALEVLASCSPVSPPHGFVEALRRPSPRARERLVHRLITGPPSVPRLRWYAHRALNEPGAGG